MSRSFSHTTLLHAPLGYLSTEVAVMRQIIQLRSSHALIISPAVSATTTIQSLPTEILTTILHDHLLPSVVADLINTSARDLAIYEDGLRNLLCAECRDYQQQVYSMENVWLWQQRVCVCERSGHVMHSNICPQRSSSKPLQGSAVAGDPKEFKNAYEWLQSRLSRDASGLVRCGAPATIWDVVSQVFSKNLGCDMIVGKSTRDLPRRWTVCSDSDQSPSVALTPRYSAVRALEQAGIGESKDDDWRHRVLFRRVEKELALNYQYDLSNPTNTHDTPRANKNASKHSPSIVSHSNPSTTSNRSRCNCSARFHPTLAIAFVVDTFQSVLAAVCTCAFLPFTLVISTVLMYCKPAAFRIL